ncbi:hypothetical protein JCM8547_001616 [Rhodosporidiobolus lusitaniae]
MAKKEENEENICGWEECGTQFETAEALFNHVCSNHIGRKSAGTLSLECKWTGCHAKASKRDHLTSHCRVHIALKPHVCSICTKAFKRPQDLKKHEKIHSEDHHTTYKSHKAAVAAAQAQAAAANGAPSHDLHGQQHLHQQQLPPQQTGYPILGAPAAVDAKGNPLNPAAAFAYPLAGLPGFGLPYAFLPNQSSFMGMPGQAQAAPTVGGITQDQLAQFIALQMQANAQATQLNNPALLSGLGFPGAGTGQYATTLGMQQAAMNAQVLQQQQQGGLFPYGNGAFTFSAPTATQPQFAATAIPLPQQQQQQQQRANGLTMTPPSTSSPPQPASALYPALPCSLYGQPSSASFLPSLPAQTQQPQVKLEGDLPSPANSARSNGGGHHQHQYSLSPSNVPALSPPSLSTPENSFSPSPELDSDSGVPPRSLSSSLAGGGHTPHGAPTTSSSSVAGKKRAFDDAAGSFLHDLRQQGGNKRTQLDTDALGSHLDALSSFLLTPEMSAPDLLAAAAGGGGGDDSSSGSTPGSDYGAASVDFGKEQVDEINQLLLSLNQGMDDHISSSSTGADLHGSLADLTGGPNSSATHHHDGRQIAPLPSSYIAQPHLQQHQPLSLYPSLPSSLSFVGSGASSTTAAASSLYTYPSPPLPGQTGHQAATIPGMVGQDFLRLSKTPAAPTIAHDYRATQYQHVARLQRAAPPAGADGMELDAAEEGGEGEGEDVDDEVKDAAAALLMGRGYSVTAVRAAASSSAKPKLPSLATALAAPSPSSTGPRLAPIHPAGADGRLPPIRELLSLGQHRSSPSSVADELDSPATSPVHTRSTPLPFSSTSSPAPSGTSSPSLYPSLASLAPTSSSRPVSAGGVERLTHRVHKLRLPSSSSSSTTTPDEAVPPAAGSSVLEDAGDLEATSDEGSSDEEDVIEGGEEKTKEKKSRHKDKKSRLDPSELSQLRHPVAVKAEPVDDDVLPAEVKPSTASSAADDRAAVMMRRRATIAYLVMYVNAKYRADLARKGVKDVRRAIKTGGGGGVGASGLKVEVKPEVEA